MAAQKCKNKKIKNKKLLAESFCIFACLFTQNSTNQDCKLF